MVAGWNLEPENSLLYLCCKVGITLSIHLLFDLQKMMYSVLHGEHGKLMHPIFYLFVAVLPLFIEALAIAGSTASTNNMQQGLYLKLCPFCSERRESSLGVWKVEHTSCCRSGVLGIWGGVGGSRLLPAFDASLARHQGEQWGKFPLQQCPSDLPDGPGLSEGSAEGGLCVSVHDMKGGMKGACFHIFLWLAERKSGL